MAWYKSLALFIVITFLLSTVSAVSNSGHHVNVMSVPEGEKFFIWDVSGDQIGLNSAPSIVSLDLGNGSVNMANYLVKYKFAGHKSNKSRSDLDNWYWSNIIFGGLDGVIILDPKTGEMYKSLDDKNIKNLIGL
ncbi:MAG: hypothetical protein HON23_03820 [Rickettsiales bacterium]|nr:hypothetical protein [Rickettsiales bacterium]